MRNWYWWLLGGGALLWYVNKSKAEPATRAEGNLEVSITWRPGTISMPAVNNALNNLSVITGCGGPPLIGATRAPSTSATAASSTINAVWTHNLMGPIKESVRVCALKALQALDKNIVDLQATRVS